MPKQLKFDPARLLRYSSQKPALRRIRAMPRQSADQVAREPIEIRRRNLRRALRRQQSRLAFAFHVAPQVHEQRLDYTRVELCGRQTHKLMTHARN